MIRIIDILFSFSIYISVTAGVPRRITQWSANQNDTDVNTYYPSQHRADVFGIDERIGVAQSRGRLRTTAGRTVTANSSTDAEHDGGASPSSIDDDHPCREPAADTGAAATAR